MEIGGGAAGDVEAREEEGAAEGGEFVEHGAELEEVAGEHSGGRDAHFKFEAEGFEADAGLRHHFGVEHRRDAGAAAGVVLAEGEFDRYESAGGREQGFHLRDEQAREFDDLFEAEGEDAVGVQAGTDIPDGDTPPVAGDDFLDVFVDEFAHGIEIVFPDVHPVGDFAVREIDEGACDEGNTGAGPAVFDPFIDGGCVEGVLVGLELLPAHRKHGVIETIGEGVLVFLVLNDGIDSAANDVLDECVALAATVDEEPSSPWKMASCSERSTAMRRD